jgi:hypothetical protein
LAFVSILLGPVTGIPAIYLARKALREAAAAPERYSGTNGAKGALVLGCAMSFLWTLVLCSGISSDSPTFAVIFVLIGLSIGALAIVGPNRNLPSVLTTLAGAARRHLAVLVLAPAFALGGIIGSAGHAQQAAEASRICAEDRSAAAGALSANDFDKARLLLKGATAACPANAGVDIATAVRDLDAKESVYRKARADADAAQKASVAAAHEQSAVDGFPALAKKIGDELRAVYSKVGQGQWAGG